MGRRMISVSLALSQTTDTGLVHRAVCQYMSQLSLALIASNIYPGRDGQAELTWAAGYIQRWFTRLPTVTHPSTNRARRWLTSLMRPTTLATEPNRRQ